MIYDVLRVIGCLDWKTDVFQQTFALYSTVIIAEVEQKKSCLGLRNYSFRQ